ncbi:MAG: hypothetical protein H5T83_08460 [Actinotalea sp.]|nr:hypothetical protein [Actinotalea sp.]
MAQARAARVGSPVQGQRLLVVKAVAVVAVTVALAGAAAAAGLDLPVPSTEVVLPLVRD